MATNAPPTHMVIVHRPGRHWQAGTPFQNQPGIEQHVQYYAGLDAEGKLFAGGPFLDSTGGMMILIPGITREEAEQLAHADPAVRSELLEAYVHPWLRAFSA